VVRGNPPRGRREAFVALSILVCFAAWAILFRWRLNVPPVFFHRAWPLFVLLSLLMKGLGSRVVPRETHSLVGIVDLAAILLFGPVGGAWVAAAGAFLYQIERGLVEGVRARREGSELAGPVLVGNLAFDSGLKGWMALVSGTLYQRVGGPAPLYRIDLSLAGPTLLLLVTWFLMDHLGWGIAEAILGGWKRVRDWLHAVIVPSLLIELAPLPLSVLVAFLYASGSPGAFLLMSAGLIATSLVIQRLVRITLQQQHNVRELMVLNEIGRAVAHAEMSVEALAELVYQQASHIVDTSFFHLGFFEGDLFTLAIRVRDGVRQPPLTVTVPRGKGIVGWMRESKQPLLVRDFVREMDRLPARPLYLDPDPPRSGVFVPLLASGEAIGSISIQSRRPAAFDEQHLRILSFIADQAALAIEKARLYQAARERAAELERIAAENARLYAAVREERDRLRLLQDVTRDLTRRLDLDDLLQRLLQRALESLKAADGVILLLGTRRETPRAISTQEGPQTDLGLILERGLAGWVIHNRQAALLPDVRKDPRWLPGAQAVGSAVAVPILHGDTPWGAITLTHPQPGFFAQADLTLLLALADQAAVALEAARQYEAQRRRAVQLQTIAEVMRSILSILDLDALLNQVVRLVRSRFGYSHAHIFTVDAEREEVIFRASTDPENPFWEARQGRLSLEEGLVGWVARHGEATIVGDVCQDPRWLPDQKDVRSEVAVPLKVGNDVVGVLDVQSDEVDAFDDEDLFILRTLADQIAVALENARLYRAEQEEAWVLNALLQVAQNIARARDLSETLETVVRLVPLLIGAEPCVLLLRERESGVFRVAHGYGAGWKALEGQVLDSRVIPALARVVQGATPLALVAEPDVEGMPVAVSGLLPGGSGWLYPLVAGGEVCSVLLLGLGAGGTPLSGKQQTILSGLAHQAGIAIQEARLRQEAEVRQRLEQELAVAREIQRRLLPECCPQIPGWSIGAAWEAARAVGGDFYDFVPLPDGRLGIVVADVSDKGVPAALFMVLSRSLVRASAVNHASPAEALGHVNRLLLEDSQAEMFVSVFYGVLDPQAGEMRYASAGHNPALLVRADGETALLQAPGVILGVIPDARLEERVVELRPGDTLVLYTDGVTETINRHEEEFGLERLTRIVTDRRADALPDVQAAVLEALKEFGEGQPPFDDLTLVLIRREL